MNYDKTLTFETVRKIAKTGDILLGNFPIPMTNMAMPIILIGDCVGCIVDKSDVEANTTHYIRKIQLPASVMYEEFAISKEESFYDNMTPEHNDNSFLDHKYSTGKKRNK